MKFAFNQIDRLNKKIGVQVVWEWKETENETRGYNSQIKLNSEDLVLASKYDIFYDFCWAILIYLKTKDKKLTLK